MKGINGQNINELVSLTILALMVIALVAGEIGVRAAAAAPSEAHAALTTNVHILIDAVSLHTD